MFGLLRVLSLVGVGAGAISLGACSAGDAPGGVAASLGPGVAVGEKSPRRDLEPAVLCALSDCGLAPLASYDIENGGRLYSVMDSFDREGWLRVDVTDGSGGANYSAAAKLGRFGEPELEKKLIERLGFHVERLREAEKPKAMP